MAAAVSAGLGHEELGPPACGDGDMAGDAAPQDELVEAQGLGWLHCGAATPMPCDGTAARPAPGGGHGYTTTTCTKVAHVTSNVAYVTMEGFPGFPSGPAATAAARDPASGELRWQSGPTLYDVVDATALNAKLQLVELAGVRDVSVWSLGGEPWFTGDPG